MGLRRLDEIPIRSHVSQVVCGMEYTLALTKEGMVYSWGRGLGLGNGYM